MHQLDRNIEALAAYERALKANADNIYYRLKKAEMLRALDRYEDALAYYEKLLKVSYLPDSIKIDSLYGKADALYNLQNYSEALKLIDRCLKIKRSFDTLFLRGHILFSLAKYQESFTSYQQASHYNQKNPAAQYNMAVCFFNVRQYQDTIAQCKKVLDQHPTYFSAHTLQGKAFSQLQRYQEALSAFEKASQLKSYEPEVFLEKARCLTHLKQFEQAIEAYERTLVLNPQAANAQKEMGDTLTTIARYREAFSAYQKAHQLDAKEDILKKIIEVLQKMEQTAPNDALKSYDALIKQTPNDAMNHILKAQALIRLQHYEDALASYTKALQLAPQNPIALQGKNETQQKLNEIAQEKVRLQQALSIQKREDSSSVPPPQTASVPNAPTQPALPDETTHERGSNQTSTSSQSKQLQEKSSFWSRIFNKNTH